MCFRSAGRFVHIFKSAVECINFDDSLWAQLWWCLRLLSDSNAHGGGMRNDGMVVDDDFGVPLKPAVEARGGRSWPDCDSRVSSWNTISLVQLRCGCAFVTPAEQHLQRRQLGDGIWPRLRFRRLHRDCTDLGGRMQHFGVDVDDDVGMLVKPAIVASYGVDSDRRGGSWHGDIGIQLRRGRAV